MTWRPALGALVAAALALPAGAVAGPETRARAQQHESGYWTPDRMQRARPLELLRSREGGARLQLRTHVPFASGEVPDPTAFPNSTNGRLFGTLAGFGPFSCSATVLDTQSGRVILTAGHCVFDPFSGHFARRFAFVPGYIDGTAPLGTWRWTSARTTEEWVRRANSNFDFAAIKLAKQGGNPVEVVAGGRPLAVNQPRNQGYVAYGYPAAFAGGERMWACLSGYGGKDPRPFRKGRAPSGIGCDMTGGASGGGWTTAAGVTSVSSFGYRGHPNIVYGPYLGRNAARLVRRIQK